MAISSPFIRLGNADPDGKPVAVVRGGKNDGKMIFLRDGTSDADRQHGKEEDNNAISEEGLQVVDKLITATIDKLATNKKMRERVEHAEKLRRMFRAGQIPKDEKLRAIYDAVRSEHSRTKDREIELDDGAFGVVPETLLERECVYVAAPSGAGKSYWCRAYAQDYNCLHPKNRVILFSKVEDDESLEGIKNLVKVPLDMALVDNPIDMDELNDALVIFDDTDTVRDKEVAQAIDLLKNDILETGRHNRTSCVITSHLITSYAKTRTVLNECSRIVVYPKSGSAHGIRYCLKTYFGLDNTEITRLLKLRSRWVCVCKHFPQLVITESQCYLLGEA